MPVVECMRCAAQLLPPTLLEHQYRCPEHGQVAALLPAIPFGRSDVAGLARRSQVPIWYPRPMPANWLLSGLRWAETPRRRAPAVVVAISGKGLADGPTDVLIVAEQPGCGLGAHFAGLAEPDPRQETFDQPVQARIRTGQRTTGMWPIVTPTDRMAFVGEAEGTWLWIIGWPGSAWALLADDLRLADGRVDASYGALESGALNPRLSQR